MPRILFKRTPTEAEGGPGHPFVEGSVFEVAPRSARRWIDMEAAVLAPIVQASSVPAAAAHHPVVHASVSTNKPLDVTASQHPVITRAFARHEKEEPPIASEKDAASGGALVAEKAKEEPTVIVEAKLEHKPNREMRPAATGADRWHVFEDGKQISTRSMPKLVAQAMVETGIDAPPIPARPGKDVGA